MGITRQFISLSLLLALLGAFELPARAQPYAGFGFVSPLQGSSTTIPPSYEALLYIIISPDADIVSVDMSTGANGLTGRFIQRWQSAAGDGIYNVATPERPERDLLPSDWNFDTHLLSNPGTTISSAVESAGTNPTVPGVGQPFGPFPTNTPSVGYLQTGIDGSLEGIITVNQPGVRYLEVAYAVDAFFDVWYAEFHADVTTTAGTSHVYTRYIPEPGSAMVTLSAILLLCRRCGRGIGRCRAGRA